MEDRPDDRVRIAEVIFVVLLLLNSASPFGWRGAAYRPLLPFLRSSLWILDLAAPAEPEAVSFAQDIGQHHCDAAGLCCLAEIDDAVGYKYDARQCLPPRNPNPPACRIKASRVKRSGDQMLDAPG